MLQNDTQSIISFLPEELGFELDRLLSRTGLCKERVSIASRNG